MKALTLTQPWATLVAIGAKRIETRSWRTAYRGELAIHAAKGFPKWARDTAEDFAIEMGGDYLAGEKHPLPLGMVIATCRLVACVPTIGLQHNTVIKTDLFEKQNFVLDDRERSFGDYESGRWAWLFADVVQIPWVTARGSLSLWEWDGAK